MPEEFQFFSIQATLLSDEKSSDCLVQSLLILNTNTSPSLAFHNVEAIEQINVVQTACGIVQSLLVHFHFTSP